MPSIQEVVHIIPLGHEYDRAIKPFEKRKADRVYILAIIDWRNFKKEMMEQQEYFRNKVIQYLEKKDIQVILRDVDLFNLLDVMHNISSIIVHEQNAGNIVNVNMSACGRLTSIGATLAGMSRGASVYYVSADGYSHAVDEYNEHGLSICNRDRIFMFENFRFDEPDAASTRILVELCHKPSGMNTKDLRSILRNMNVPGFDIDTDQPVKHLKNENKRLESTKQLMKLEKRYLQPLERSGYISRVKSGRNNIISITEAGKYIANISGLLE